MKTHKLTVAQFDELRNKTDMPLKVVGIDTLPPREVIIKKMVRDQKQDVVEFSAFKPEDEAALEALLK